MHRAPRVNVRSCRDEYVTMANIVVEIELTPQGRVLVPNQDLPGSSESDSRPMRRNAAPGTTQTERSRWHELCGSAVSGVP